MLNSDHGRAFSLVRTKLQEAKMWADKILKQKEKHYQRNTLTIVKKVMNLYDLRFVR